MKKIQRLVLIILVFTMMSSLAIVQAADQDPYDPPGAPEDYVNISGFQCSLTKSASGVGTCSSQVTTRNSSYTISLTMTLQRSSDKASWSNVYSWSKTGTGHVYLTGYYALTSGYWYQCVAFVTVRTSSGTPVESAYLYSNIVKG